MAELGETVGERYELGPLLGSGASGLVYEARDRSRGARVAVKRLRSDGPLDVARLKREFRTLADVLHPNLVRLHELDGDGDEVLLVMELVEGRGLLDWVWADEGPVSGPTTGGTTWSTLEETPMAAPPRTRSRPSLGPAVLERLRVALRGLASGLSALHAAGLLHRDVKPSNVLVTEAGHVVLVDFGLATRAEAVGGGMAGTVAYMAPEQVAGDPLSPASDWYAVGCLLFEALTGRTPFVGAPVQVLFAKGAEAPPDVREVAADVPEDLAALCTALLARDPVARPDGDTICRILGVAPSEVDAPAPFVGRSDELEALRAAWRRPGTRVVNVRGPSGYGKTRLVERFLEEVGEGAVVLAARCYERERAPYKAVDPLVDALADALAARRDLDELVPDGVGAVVRLFPALGRVPGLRPGMPANDPLLERRRATDALRELLRRLGQRTPTVIWIDDLQWGDRDSTRMIAALLRSPDPPPVLVVLGWRSDDPGVEPLLEPLVGLPADSVELAPLDADAARALVARDLADEEALVERILAEAAGSPFFLGEIARWVAEGQRPGDGSLVAAVVAARTASLAEPARHLLETVAVAGRPLLPELAVRATERATGSASSGELVLLTVRRLLTTRRGRELECTHDRIREAVAGALPPDTVRARHRAIAEEMGPEAPPQLLSEHWEHAGEPQLAAGHALRAARLAEEALAFERATTLYRRALTLGRFTGEERHRHEVALGRALAKSGRGEAADVLLKAAERAAPAERVLLEREAAHQLLRSGHFERAYELLPRVVAEVGLTWPRSRWLGFAEVVVRSARPVWLPRARRADREALELAMDLAMSLSFADMLRAAVFSARAIDLAERIGVPETVAVARAMRCSNAALLGDLASAERWRRRSLEVIPVGADEGLVAAVQLHHGIADAAQDRFEAAHDRLARCVPVFERAGGMRYEIGMALTFQTYATVQRGDLAGYRALRARVIDDARSRGDKHLEVLFRVSFAFQPGLLDDDPEAALDNLRLASARWGANISTAWLYTEVALAQVDVYRGRHRQALERVARILGPAGRNGLLRIQLNAVIAHIALASAAAPLAASDPAARDQLRRAIRGLRANPVGAGRLQAETWAAVDLAVGGDREGAVARLDRVLPELPGTGIPWLEEMVRLQRAGLVGEDPAPWTERLAARGIVDPVRMSSLYAWSP